MQSYQIQDTKLFMHQLLADDTFHSFLVAEAELTTFVSYKISGNLHADYYDTSDPDQAGPGDLCSWKSLQPLLFQLVKGKHRPLSMHIVLKQSPQNTERFLTSCSLKLNPSDLNGLYLNIHYDGHQVTCITGISLRIFTTDRSVEHAWDEMIAKLMKQKNIPFVISTQYK